MSLASKDVNNRLGLLPLEISLFHLLIMTRTLEHNVDSVTIAAIIYKIRKAFPNGTPLRPKLPGATHLAPKL